MWRPSQQIVAIVLAVLLSVVSGSSLAAQTVDEALNTSADINDQAVKAADLVNAIYESGLPRIYKKAGRIVELADLESIGSDVLEELTRDAMGDSSLIADLQLKQLDSLIGMMRTSQTNFVNLVKELQAKRRVGQRRANKILRRSMDVSFLIDQLEHQVNASGSKLESIDSLLSNIATSLNGQSSDDTIDDLPRLFPIARLAYKDRLSLRETLRNLTKLILQNGQDLRESQRLANRVNRSATLLVLSSSSFVAQQIELKILDLQGRVLQHFMGAQAPTAALNQAEKNLANGVYFYLLKIYDSTGKSVERKMQTWVVRH
jgi:hypothetical protein